MEDARDGGHGDMHLISKQRRPKRSIARLKYLAELPPDWNSYGGLPPTQRAIEQSILIVQASEDLARGTGQEETQPFAIAPLPDGGISMLWKGPGGELDLEVDPAGQIGILFEPSRDASSEAIDRDDASVQDVLTFLHKTLNSHAE